MTQAAAARLITKVVDAQASRGYASVVLTGGRNGNGLLAALAAAPAERASTGAVSTCGGVTSGSCPGRSGPQQHQPCGTAGLGAGETARVHPMPASDGPYGTDVDAAAEAYAAELAKAASNCAVSCPRSTS